MENIIREGPVRKTFAEVDWKNTGMDNFEGHTRAEPPPIPPKTYKIGNITQRRFALGLPNYDKVLTDATFNTTIRDNRNEAERNQVGFNNFI